MRPMKHNKKTNKTKSSELRHSKPSLSRHYGVLPAQVKQQCHSLKQVVEPSKIISRLQDSIAQRRMRSYSYIGCYNMPSRTMAAGSRPGEKVFLKSRHQIFDRYVTKTHNGRFNHNALCSGSSVPHRTGAPSGTCGLSTGDRLECQIKLRMELAESTVIKAATCALRTRKGVGSSD